MTAAILTFPTPHRAAPPPAAIDAVAELLLALEDAPLFEPAVTVARDLSGRPDLCIIAAGRRFRLSPLEARLAAETLTAENAFAGCVGIAHTLHQAAALADRMRRVG